MLTFLNYRLYKTEGKLIPEFRSVAEFMVDLLDDCSGGTDGTYMTLRVGVSANEISRGEGTYSIGVLVFDPPFFGVNHSIVYDQLELYFLFMH